MGVKCRVRSCPKPAFYRFEDPTFRVSNPYYCQDHGENRVLQYSSMRLYVLDTVESNDAEAELWE